MNPRILVVENRRAQLEAVKFYLEEIPADRRAFYGIHDFLVAEAAAAATARKLLQEAKDRSQPYDILLLDLGLPEVDGEDYEDPEKGLEILTFTRQLRAARAIIVVSKFAEIKYARPAFRGGAVDFVAKPYDPEELRGRVLVCWDHLLAQDSAQILEERIRTLVPHAERGLAHRFGGCFSRFVQSVVAEAEKLESDFGYRLGLDMQRDPHDPLIRRLAALEKSVTERRRDWIELQKELAGEDKGPQEAVFEDMLDKIVERLLPCLTLKRVDIVKPREGTTRILTFDEDVRTVLTEMMLGGLSELPDHSEPPGDFEISVSNREQYAEVRFVDNLVPLPGDLAETINHGNAVSPDGKFGRAWGLSVVQHAALRGGGRLVVEPRTDGNIITYLIPLAQHV